MLFQTEKAVLKPMRAIANLYDAMFLSGAVLGIGTALLFAGSLDKPTKACLTGFGVAGMVCYTINTKVSEKPRRVGKVLDTVQWEGLKHQLKEEEEIHELAAHIDGASRKAELILRKSQPWEWKYWAKQAGVTDNMPPMEELTGEELSTVPSSVSFAPNPDIATISPDQISAVVSPSELVKLEAISQAYPKYVRTDADWIDELCTAASNPDMSKRFNHHFIVTGETQSGKSTIAGVIINKVAGASKVPSINIGNDPKDGVSRWLCKFSYRFDGIEAIDNWVQYAFKAAQDQKKSYSKNPKDTGEIFFVQDEVDSVYNGGKGFLGFPGADKKIQAAQAQSLQSLWNFLVKYMAGAKGHYIGIGQSPLSSDTGLSRPAYKSCCFIALGNTANYIFDHPQDFLNVNKEIQEILLQAFEMMTNAGQRCALVIPMRGNPYVALIPQFDVDGYQNQSAVSVVKVNERSLLTLDQIMQQMTEWMMELEELPSPEDIRKKWESLSEVKLTPSQFKAVLKGLGLEE